MIIVEDEKSIRENLQKGILWEKYGFHIVAEAANGEEALENGAGFRSDLCNCPDWPVLRHSGVNDYAKGTF